MIYVCFGLLAFVVWREWEHDRDMRAVMLNKGIAVEPIIKWPRKTKVEPPKRPAI